jgi:hypothetical protein
MKNLKSFESAAKYVGIDPNKLPDVSILPEQSQKSVIAFYKLSIVSQAAWKQEGKVIDWNDWDQYKYYPWFRMSDSVGSSGGFSYGVCLCDDTASVVGSRLVFPTLEIAKYVGKTLIDLYRDFMVI